MIAGVLRFGQQGVVFSRLNVNFVASVLSCNLLPQIYIARAGYATSNESSIKGRGSPSKTYAYKLTNLCRNNNPIPFSIAVEKLRKQIDETFVDLTKEHVDKEIKSFRIGKSYVRQRKKRSGDLVPFDGLEPSSWKLDGIHSRWRYYSNIKYNGLIVVAAVTKDYIPYDFLTNLQDYRVELGKTGSAVELYTVGLEQSLIHHYLLKQRDHRCENISFYPGKFCKIEPVAGIVYVAYKLKSKPLGEVSK